MTLGVFPLYSMEQGCCPKNIPLCPAFDNQDLLRKGLVVRTPLTENFEFTGFIASKVQTVCFDHSSFLGVLFDSYLCHKSTLKTTTLNESHAFQRPFVFSGLIGG
jgi:hypothetical protein